MADPITLTAIGLYACNQAVGFAVNVASDLSMGKWRSKTDYTNHDIPRAVREAWKQAIKSVLGEYATEHNASLNDADEMAIKTAIKELWSGEFADAMFLGIGDALPAEALDLSGNPLPALTSNEHAIEAGHQLVRALREHAKTKPLLSKVPESLYDHCAEHLVCAMSYFYVEIAIKDDEKACKQIMYRIAQDSWVLMSQMNDGIERVEQGVERIESGMENLLTASRIRDQKIDTVADYLVAQLQTRDGQIDELRQQVRDAVAAKVAAEEAAGRSPDAVLDELRGGDATKLLEFLDRYVDEDERRLIERHRERAAVAYVVGDLDRASNSLGKIIALLPGDLRAINQFGHIALTRGHLDEAKRLYTQILDAAPDDEWRAIAFGNLGLIEKEHVNLEVAEEFFKRSLAINEELGLKAEMASLLGSLGIIELMVKNYVNAKSYFNQSLTINEDLGCKEGMAAIWGNFGVMERLRGNFEKSKIFHGRSLAIEKEIGRKEGVARQFMNLGIIEGECGDLEEAEKYLRQSVKMNKEIGSIGMVAHLLSELGENEIKRKNVSTAIEYHKQSLNAYKELEREDSVERQIAKLVAIELKRGGLEAAEGYLKRSLAINEKLGSKEGMADNFEKLGLIEQSHGNLEGAEDYLKRSLAINKELGSKEGMVNQLECLGLIELTRGNLEVAEGYLKRSLAINEELGRKEGVAIDLGSLGLFELKRGNEAAAEDYCKRSLAINEELGRKEGMANQLGNLGLIEQARGNEEAARWLWVRARDLFAEIGMPQMVEKVQAMIDGLDG